jgi:selenoprotein W-related protein
MASGLQSSAAGPLSRSLKEALVGDRRPRIVIRNCTQCRGLLRAAWLAQELLSTFGTDLGEVALAPGIGSVFEIT